MRKRDEKRYGHVGFVRVIFNVFPTAIWYAVWGFSQQMVLENPALTALGNTLLL
jgi:hypothetical protein